MRALPLLLVAAVLAACDSPGGPPPQTGGEYRVVLESPHGAEGAASIDLVGTGIESVVADEGALFEQPVGAARRVVVVREPAGAIRFRIVMAPGHPLPTAEVVEVVDGDDRPRASLAGYRVTLAR